MAHARAPAPNARFAAPACPSACPHAVRLPRRAGERRCLCAAVHAPARVTATHDAAAAGAAAPPRPAPRIYTSRGARGEPPDPRRTAPRTAPSPPPAPRRLSDTDLVKELARAPTGKRVLALLAEAQQARPSGEPPLPAAVLAALQSLARRSTERGWAQDARVQALLVTAGTLAPGFAPQEAATCAWALARLGAPVRWMPALLAAAQPAALQPRELSKLLWALGSLHAQGTGAVRARHVSDSWLAAYWSALSPALPGFSAKDVGMLCYGLGALGATPPVMLRLALERTSTALLPECTPCELAHLLYGFTAWRGEPPSEQWTRTFWGRAQGVVTRRECSARELANLLHAAAVLGAPLQPATLDALEAATGARMADFAPRDLAQIVWALCRLSRVPSEEWLDALVAEVRRQVHACQARELSVLLWALADLAHRPSDAWLAAFSAASLRKLPDATPQALANLAWACAVLDAAPPDAWMEAFASRALEVLPGFSRQGLAMVCWALVVLQAYRSVALPAVWAHLLLALESDDTVAVAAAGGNEGDDVADVQQLHRCQIDLRTLYEVYTVAAAESPGVLPPPNSSLLDAARESWRTETAAAAGGSRASRTYMEVAAAIRDSLALTPAESVVCSASGRLVDLALERGGARLALQVDGPQRFLRNTWQPSGATRLRDRALTAAGWRVVSLPFYTLDELRTPEPRADYLRRRLAEVDPTPDAHSPAAAAPAA